MKVSAAQPGLFDFDAPADEAQAESGRARMREMIDRLRVTDVPPWKNQMAIILDDGAFQRAMRLVPVEEAQALWGEFDAHMERLNAIWVKANPAREG